MAESGSAIMSVAELYQSFEGNHKISIEDFNRYLETYANKVHSLLTHSGYIYTQDQNFDPMIKHQRNRKNTALCMGEAPKGSAGPRGRSGKNGERGHSGIPGMW